MTHDGRGMRLREAALSVAIGECVNAVREEGGENKGEKVRAYLRNAEIPVPAPWCAAFVQWATDGAAGFLAFENPLDAVHREALVSDYMALSEQEGWTVPPDRAEPGDLVCYKFGAGDRWNHIGFVLSKPRRVEGRFNWMAVEGNTSPGVGLSEAEREREGDGVYKKRRRFRENRTAFVAWDNQRAVDW